MTATLWFRPRRGARLGHIRELASAQEPMFHICRVASAATENPANAEVATIASREWPSVACKLTVDGGLVLVSRSALNAAGSTTELALPGDRFTLVVLISSVNVARRLLSRACVPVRKWL